MWKPSVDEEVAGPLLLDTHVWIWLLEGAADRMNAAVVSVLQRCAVRADLVVCDMSFWEVAIKAAKRKLILSMEVALWLRRAERAPGITYLPLDREILLLSTQLRGEPHGDPVDRMLIAAAQLHGFPFVTADQPIIDYARAQRTFSVCDARP